MFKIIFPEYTGQRYYHIHYLYLLEIFRYLKCDITFRKIDGCVININNTDFLFDYSDDATVIPKCDLPIFKFHTLEKDLDKVIPFPPISFLNWDQYYNLARQIKYNPENNVVSNRQRPYGNALERRNKVQSYLKGLLVEKYLKTEIIDQKAFWKEINDIWAFIHIGGYCQNIIDRAPFQIMAFGGLVISNKIPEQLPFRCNFDGCYLMCEDNYSNLDYIILEKPMQFLKRYRNIAEEAKIRFQNTSTPSAIGDWISLHV